MKGWRKHLQPVAPGSSQPPKAHFQSLSPQPTTLNFQRNTIAIITDGTELNALRPEWSKLWERCPRATPFQSPEWLLPWWRCFGNDSLHTLLLRRHGLLVALMPGYILNGCFQMLGIGSSDHLDLLVEPGFEIEATQAILEYLTGDQTRWKRCKFQQLADGSPLLKASLQPGWRDELTTQNFCPVLSLPGSVEELHSCIPGHQLRNVRYYRRLTEKAGVVRFESARKENLDTLLEALMNLHTLRWSERGEPGVLTDAAVVDFLRQASDEFLAAGILRLYALFIDERIAGVLCGFRDKRRFYYYISGFDPAFGNLGVGTLLVHYAIEEAVREGLKEFDFLRGQEPYKYFWGAKDRPSWSRALRRQQQEGPELP